MLKSNSIRFSYSLGPFVPSPIQGIVMPISRMEASIMAVEGILGYKFKNKQLLEEALTHSSYTESASYRRLEFLGDVALGLALSNYLFLAYPDLDSGHMSLLRAANVSTEKFARVAIRHGLFKYLRHNDPGLDEKIRVFEVAIRDEEDADDAVAYGGSVKAPKVLADIVESVAAAVYVDCNFDLETFWVIFRGLLEPIVTLEDLHIKPQPVTMLFKLCQKQWKHVEFRYWRHGKKTIANVFVGGKFLAAGSSEQKDTAKICAARAALYKIAQSMINEEMTENCKVSNSLHEIDGPNRRLLELDGKKKRPRQIYEIESPFRARQLNQFTRF